MSQDRIHYTKDVFADQLQAVSATKHIARLTFSVSGLPSTRSAETCLRLTLPRDGFSALLERLNKANRKMIKSERAGRVSKGRANRNR